MISNVIFFTHLRNTKTVGITALGLDHKPVLGHTHEDVAWHKCGIIKHGSNVFSTPQHKEYMPTILNRVREKEVRPKAKENVNSTINISQLFQANLKFVPEFIDYKYDDEQVFAEIVRNPTKRLNASLAIQLCYDWIRRNEHKVSDKSILEQLKVDQSGLKLHKKIIAAISGYNWPGRCQKLTYRSMTIYIDGAHTIESTKLCIDWFSSVTRSEYAPNDFNLK